MAASEACEGDRQESFFDKKEPDKLIIDGHVITLKLLKNI